MMLALLPVDKIFSTFEMIVNGLGERYSEIFNTFIDYMQDTWLNSHRWNDFSVYRTMHRTNNIAEAYHSRLRHRLIKRPSPWKFLMELLDILCVTHRNYRSSKKGVNVKISNPRSLSQITQLRKKWDELDANIISNIHFLACANNILKKKTPRMKIIDECEISSGEENIENESLFVNENCETISSETFTDVTIQCISAAPSKALPATLRITKTPVIATTDILQQPVNVLSNSSSTCSSDAPSKIHINDTSRSMHKILPKPLPSTLRMGSLQLELFRKHYQLDATTDSLCTSPASTKTILKKTDKKYKVVAVPVSKFINLKKI